MLVLVVGWRWDDGAECSAASLFQLMPLLDGVFGRLLCHFDHEFVLFIDVLDWAHRLDGISKGLLQLILHLIYLIQS